MTKRYSSHAEISKAYIDTHGTEHILMQAISTLHPVLEQMLPRLEAGEQDRIVLSIGWDDKKPITAPWKWATCPDCGHEKDRRKIGNVQIRCRLNLSQDHV